VAKTKTWGGIPTFVAPKTQVGNIVAVPETNWVITKSSIERANAKSHPARMPGKISGSVTLRNVTTWFAPRSIAASSNERSRFAARARTVTATNGMLNITCERNRVPSPRGTARDTKNEASAAPSTTSGDEIARKIAMFVALFPR
jgi:hypothetical protein